MMLDHATEESGRTDFSRHWGVWEDPNRPCQGDGARAGPSRDGILYPCLVASLGCPPSLASQSSSWASWGAFGSSTSSGRTLQLKLHPGEPALVSLQPTGGWDTPESLGLHLGLLPPRGFFHTPASFYGNRSVC
ncbi:hypothetical protein NHX12_025705 [Muraenolepis orangiensis]|uniref:Uncharacterized protein n=1 Tax=Muraenolepis orangiensis TaxID=630683 RepID=A0A9Q0EF55_9TELE|nr:hypothetical protein NHX12_025705 [Muraenolepis orangiensis]